MNHSPLRLAALALLSLSWLACSGDDPADAASAAGAAGSNAAGSAGTGGSSGSSGAATTCSGLWGQITTTYPDAGTLGPCEGAAAAVAGSLFKLDGITIDNNGARMTPCVEARCDANFVYVATNTLPHYDFIQTTPNPLAEAPQILRVPRVATPIAAGVDADSSAVATCVDAYNQYLAAPATATQREPSSLCVQADGDKEYLQDTLAKGGPVTYRKVNCLGTIAFLINGVVVAGPNEGPMPDPYGNPIFFYPEKAGQTYGGANTAALDLCGGHTGNSMHYHGVTEACFERDEQGAPANSYAEAAATWDFAQALGGACDRESGVVGWSPDGHPIKGPCVCTQRGADGVCTEVRRARSAWAYQGLGSWSGSPGANNDSAGALTQEGTACSTDDDCCAGSGDCHFKCNYAVFDTPSVPGGTTEGKRCVLLDYSWCSHRFVDRTAADTSAASFVYLDRCNGFEGPDGYAYHATASFPFLLGCYRDEPATLPGGGAPGGDAMGGGNPMGGGDPMGGGNAPPTCQPGQTQCCGDGVCDGPENAQNCAADCP